MNRVMNRSSDHASASLADAQSPAERPRAADQGALLIFDADCVLCSAGARFVLDRERDDVIRFVSAWSQTGLDAAAAHGFSRADLDETFLFIEHGRALAKSDASLAVAAHLKAPWRWARALRWIPRGLRDAAYSMLARRRYRWFGKKDRCFIPPPHARERFISH